MSQSIREKIKSYLFLFGVALIIIVPDQITKYLVRTNLDLGEMWAPWDWLSPYARVVHWYNTGVALGMFQDRNTLFAITAVLVSAAIIYYYPQISSNDRVVRLALSMQLGGAIGNLIDRVTLGHVLDFISVGNFPVFNIADSSITVGVAVLLLGLFIQERKAIADRKMQEAAEAADTPYPPQGNSTLEVAAGDTGGEDDGNG